MGTNVSCHNRVWAQTCLGTNVCGHNRVWAQTREGTIVCGHNRVGSIVWAQSCMGPIVWSPFTTVFPKVTTELHSLPETRIFIFPLFTFVPLLSIAALHMLKHSTTSISGSGGFANISSTVVIDSWMESSSRVRQHENRKLYFLFKKGLNWILTCILTYAEVLKTL